MEVQGRLAEGPRAEVPRAHAGSGVVRRGELDSTARRTRLKGNRSVERRPDVENGCAAMTTIAFRVLKLRRVPILLRAFADSCRRDLKNGSDLGVGFSASELGEHFKFARGEGAVSVWPVRVRFINLFPSY